MQEMIDRVEAVAGEVAEELESAMSKHAPMRGPHEGYAVILEEVDELWDEVKVNPKKAYGDDPAGRAKHRAEMRKEAIQVAAMAMRFVIEVCDAQ